MANNYTQFSEVLTDLTVEEYAWLVRVITAEVDTLEDADLKRLAKEMGIREEELQWQWPPFSYEFRDEGSTLWYYAGESFEPEMLGVFLVAFMKHNKRKGRIAVTWAETCSNPRIGEFGGGTLVATAHGWNSVHTWSLVEDVAAGIPKE